MTAACPTSFTAASRSTAGNENNDQILDPYTYRVSGSDGTITRWNYPALDGATTVYTPSSGHTVSCLAADDAGTFYWLDREGTGTALRKSRVQKSSDFSSVTMLLEDDDVADYFTPGSGGSSFLYTNLAWSPADAMLYLVKRETVVNSSGGVTISYCYLVKINPSTGATTTVYTTSVLPSGNPPGYKARFLDGTNSMAVTPDGALWGGCEGTGTDDELWRYAPGSSIAFSEPVDGTLNYFVGVCPTPANTVYVGVFGTSPHQVIEVASDFSQSFPSCGFSRSDLDDYQTFRGWSPDHLIHTFGRHISSLYWQWVTVPSTMRARVGRVYA